MRKLFLVYALLTWFLTGGSYYGTKPAPHYIDYNFNLYKIILGLEDTKTEEVFFPYYSKILRRLLKGLKFKNKNIIGRNKEVFLQELSIRKHNEIYNLIFYSAITASVNKTKKEQLKFTTNDFLELREKYINNLPEKIKNEYINLNIKLIRTLQFFLSANIPISEAVYILFAGICLLLFEESNSKEKLRTIVLSLKQAKHHEEKIMEYLSEHLSQIAELFNELLEKIKDIAIKKAKKIRVFLKKPKDQEDLIKNENTRFFMRRYESVFAVKDKENRLYFPKYLHILGNLFDHQPIEERFIFKRNEDYFFKYLKTKKEDANFNQLLSAIFSNASINSGHQNIKVEELPQAIRSEYINLKKRITDFVAKINKNTNKAIKPSKVLYILYYCLCCRMVYCKDAIDFIIPQLLVEEPLKTWSGEITTIISQDLEDIWNDFVIFINAMKSLIQKQVKPKIIQTGV